MCPEGSRELRGEAEGGRRSGAGKSKSASVSQKRSRKRKPTRRTLLGQDASSRPGPGPRVWGQRAPRDGERARGARGRDGGGTAGPAPRSPSRLPASPTPAPAPPQRRPPCAQAPLGGPAPPGDRPRPRPAAVTHRPPPSRPAPRGHSPEGGARRGGGALGRGSSRGSPRTGPSCRPAPSGRGGGRGGGNGRRARQGSLPCPPRPAPALAPSRAALLPPSRLQSPRSPAPRPSASSFSLPSSPPSAGPHARGSGRGRPRRLAEGRLSAGRDRDGERVRRRTWRTQSLGETSRQDAAKAKQNTGARQTQKKSDHRSRRH